MQLLETGDVARAPKMCWIVGLAKMILQKDKTCVLKRRGIITEARKKWEK